MYFYIKDLTPVLSGQFSPANYCQGHWLFQTNIKNRKELTPDVCGQFDKVIYKVY